MSSSTAHEHHRIQWRTPPRSDVILAVVVWLLEAVTFSDLSSAAPVAVAYSILGYAPLAWRRTAPVAVFLLLWLHFLGGLFLIEQYRPILGLLVALYTVATITGWRASVPAMFATYVTMTPSAVRQEWEQSPEDSRMSIAVFLGSMFAMFVAGAWGLGRWARSSRNRLEDLELRRERDAAEAVRAERRRIAHELHDILSHSVSVMVLQAAGARRVLGTDPARADTALAHIEGVGKQSMAELRRLLGVLDAPTADTGPPSDEGPQPGLAELSALLEGMRLSGLNVRLVEEGTRARLDPSVDLSAYRIIQESLTNSIKHAGREATAMVHLIWGQQNLILEVVDDGGATALHTGDLSTQHGLPGLSERARAVGGHLEAGPVASGGFRVSATLPVSATGIQDLGIVAERP